MPFLSPIRHNLATHLGSENIVVKVTTEDALTGYGEGVPRAFVTGETLTASLAFVEEVLASAALGLDCSSPQALLPRLAQLFQEVDAARYPAAFCALEMALLDAAGRTWDMRVADFFGGNKRESIIYSAVIPMASKQQMAHFFDLVRMGKMHFLKFKVGAVNDLEMLRLVREKLGDEIDIRVDANAAWSPAEAIRHIRAMEPFHISAVEQPVGKRDFAGLKQVRDAVSVPLIADESLCTFEDAQRLIDLGACQIFNIRLSKCGGLGTATRIAQLAAQAGILCQLGCHVGETSILSAAGRHFALSSPGLTYVEGSFAPYLLVKDPVARPVDFGYGGVGHALAGSGLGIEVLDQVLDELAVSHQVQKAA